MQYLAYQSVEDFMTHVVIITNQEVIPTHTSKNISTLSFRSTLYHYLLKLEKIDEPLKFWITEKCCSTSHATHNLGTGGWAVNHLNTSKTSQFQSDFYTKTQIQTLAYFIINFPLLYCFRRSMGLLGILDNLQQNM